MDIQLTPEQKTTLKDLQTQEQVCIDKYTKYASEAKDVVLQNLFTTLKGCEQKHYDALGQMIQGTVEPCDCNSAKGQEYAPKATYTAGANEKDKADDSFLATDAITSEKLVSGEYNSDIFAFGDANVRKYLAHIQIEEQNHAEMLYKYKEVNNMTS